MPNNDGSAANHGYELPIVGDKKSHPPCHGCEIGKVKNHPSSEHRVSPGVSL